MKVAMRVMAVAAVLAMASAVNADTALWFSASNPQGGAGVDVPGGPGQTLALSCDASGPAVCTWTITMAFQNDLGSADISGWATDLTIPQQAVGKIDIVPGSFTYAANVFTVHTPAVGPSLNNGGNLLTDANGTSFAGASAGGNLASFTLRKTKTAGNINLDAISMVTGGLEWIGTDGNYPTINGVVDGGAGLTELGVGISIRNFPEPSSLALLGLGVLALIRRR